MPTSSGCCKNYPSRLENALEMENAGILPEDLNSLVSGVCFLPPAPIQALNAQVSKNQLSFQWPEK